MLSPFRGIMHSVATRWADAVTTDGRHWTLYVRGECLYDDLDEVGNTSVTVPDVKYGTWSDATGFQRAPIRMPTFDEQVCAHGERLLVAIVPMNGEADTRTTVDQLAGRADQACVRSHRAISSI